VAPSPQSQSRYPNKDAVLYQRLVENEGQRSMSDTPAAVLIAKRSGRAPLTLLSASVLARFDVLERTDFLMMVFVYGWR
jgi:hypothetical protein